MSLSAFTEVRLVAPEREIADGVLVVEDDVIRAVGPRSEIEIPRGCREERLPGKIIVPGFIDLHLHGGGGRDFSGKDQIEEAVEYHARHGTTSMLLTVEPAAALDLKKRLALVGRCCGPSAPGLLPEVLGVHLEGPFLNRKWCGALDSRHVADPDPVLFSELIDASTNTVRIMTLAPELPGGGDMIRMAGDAGIVAALGHSDATFEQAQEAFAAGVTHVTHLFNAMRGVHHRDPGCGVAALLAPRVTAEVIVDGCHLHSAMVQLAHRLKGAAAMILVSDAVPLAGAGSGSFSMGGQRVQVREGRAENESGSLAGSLLTMGEAVKRSVVYGRIPLREAVEMAALNPARRLGVTDRKGRLTAGADADFVVLNDALDVERVYIGARPMTQS
ncbi:MAG: N-acetylglucosamine-6-phosphate deacetylase [bacterium]|nr:N-acetylglucosamine-6-phosphate deacetylase [bacterium]